MRINKFEQCAMYTLFAVWGGMSVQFACAEALNTQVPKQQEETFSVPVNIDIPQQPLANSLHALGKATGMSVSFPNDLVSGKTAPEVRGRMTRQEALRRMLNDTGLAPKIEADSVYIQKAPQKKEDKTVQLDKVEVRAKRFYEVGPLPGLGLTKEEIPGNVQSISAKEIKEAHSLSLTDLMNRKLQSVTVNDYQGNPFQMDVQYRGFTAGPQIGTPQGLSVFIDGIRVNEPFGDIVNWDMIPMNALASVDVFPGSNPIFGLNTLGGAFSLKTKDGFNNPGVDADILTGSFGRKQLQLEGGWNNGTIGLFGAGNFFLEDGWRKNSPSRVNQFFSKASYRGDKLDLNLSTLLVQTNLVGNGVLPLEMYAQDRDGVFTAPDRTKNKLDQYQLSGSFFATETFTVTGQIYRRNSKRHQIGADVYTEYGNSTAIRNLTAGAQYTCLYESTKYGLPNYYVLQLPGNIDPDRIGTAAIMMTFDPANASAQDQQLYNQYYLGDNQVKLYVDAIYFGQPADLSVLPASARNADLPDDFVQYAKYNFDYYKNLRASQLYTPQAAGAQNTYNPPNRPGQIIVDGTSFFEYGYIETAQKPAIPQLPGPVDVISGINHYYYGSDGNGGLVRNVILTERATNAQECSDGQAANPLAQTGGVNDTNPDGTAKQYDGAQFNGTGLVEGVPTAVITNTRIDQKIDGGSLQFNWNLDHHKFMIGASIDAADTTYVGGQQLGFFDAQRKAYLAPDQALDGLLAADMEIFNNNFQGTSTTKSIYASETWSPIDNLHFSTALRYNMTSVKNVLASRSYGFSVANLHQIIGNPDEYNICNPGQSCPTGYRVPEIFNLLNPAETEKFNYYSLNPSLGVSWQANENLNFYSNWAKGSRVPSVIELGCALDRTPVQIGSNPDGTPREVFKSIAENRSCSLPSALSGDPHLPQIIATTYDVGFRGKWGNNIEWNIGAYRTDLKDDIYLVTFPGNRNFFDTIGETRRQGIEMGIGGKVDRLGFKVNYAMTDATFQDTFQMASNDNSSGVPNELFGTGQAGEATPRVITVRPGNKMPGVGLHNLNANLTYDVTDKWTVGLSAVAHSESFVRGNENNEHRKGVTQFISYEVPDPINGGTQTLQVARQPTSNPGKVAGYATLNFQTSYKLAKEWTATLLVTNLLDKEYFSAGRLGRNPFSPSINGAIGPDGYNHNSGDWLSTNFIAPGAPRGIWFSLNWHFVPD
jgi:outer membrane receptor protein involved in Fe transport